MERAAEFAETELRLLCPGPLFFLLPHISLECECWGFIIFLPSLISFHLLVWDLPEYWLYVIVFLTPQLSWSFSPIELALFNMLVI